MATQTEEDKKGFEIDDSLYSRQRYVLGDDAMQNLSKADIFIAGMGGVGVEIAKNVVLAGVKSVTLQDTKIAKEEDLGVQFFLREEDVNAEKNKAVACCSRVAELNPYVKVYSSTEPLDGDNLGYLSKYKCVVLTECPLKLQLKVNEFCRNQNPPIKGIILAKGVADVLRKVPAENASGQKSRRELADLG